MQGINVQEYEEYEILDTETHYLNIFETGQTSVTPASFGAGFIDITKVIMLDKNSDEITVYYVERNNIRGIPYDPEAFDADSIWERFSSEIDRNPETLVERTVFAKKGAAKEFSREEYGIDHPFNFAEVFFNSNFYRENTGD